MDLSENRSPEFDWSKAVSGVVEVVVEVHSWEGSGFRSFRYVRLLSEASAKSISVLCKCFRYPGPVEVRRRTPDRCLICDCFGGQLCKKTLSTI